VAAPHVREDLDWRCVIDFLTDAEIELFLMAVRKGLHGPRDFLLALLAYRRGFSVFGRMAAAQLFSGPTHSAERTHKVSGNTLSITVEAIYESGILKPLAPLPELADKSRVRVTIEPAGKPAPKVRRSHYGATDYSRLHEWLQRKENLCNRLLKPGLKKDEEKGEKKGEKKACGKACGKVWRQLFCDRYTIVLASWTSRRHIASAFSHLKDSNSLAMRC
jgi:predicted DNA-binding antitoxin AbrB/MazE fold protein